ncbi:enoyl-CoA hydratase/isomerase family protein [Bradyrhizobium australafricanum]|uniref:enoyl-CoA hydratase/isomerase family protein n=1 Tax=Bradyrhizobium australafricanum TaxID=2821406 RepID=UPI001CE39570|nr:enoyl-CoA hydratase/isomerase family protein [Bradyrhizobium australafricanum]MCA6100503.1 enoyl-CoA hydratase/isomerase family protein [Bradyrhizobium australafricanum]
MEAEGHQNGQADNKIVTVERHGNVAVVTMVHRPYNLSGPTLYRALLAAFEGAVEAGSRAILLKSGLRHFCAGADVSLWDERIANEGRAAMDPLILLRGFEQLPVPIVAAVHGACLGGGLELVLACDISVVAASAKLGSVEVALGVHPLLGGIQRQVQRIGAVRAKEMALLGHRYDAATLERWGLINRVVPDDQLESAALTIAQELAHGPTVAHAATKRLVAIATNEGVDAADQKMWEIQKPVWASQDLRTGLDSFRARGPGFAVFEGK